MPYGTDIEREIMRDIRDGLDVKDFADECIWKKARMENCAILLAKKGYRKQEWISVSERLPEEDKDVIAFCYWHESWQMQVCHRSSNWPGQWYTSIAGQWVPSVSHWMPLPTPPKGE